MEKYNSKRNYFGLSKVLRNQNKSLKNLVDDKVINDKQRIRIEIGCDMRASTLYKICEYVGEYHVKELIEDNCEY